MDEKSIKKLRVAITKVQAKGYKIDSKAARGTIMNISKPKRKNVEHEMDKQISYVLANSR